MFLIKEKYGFLVVNLANAVDVKIKCLEKINFTISLLMVRAPCSTNRRIKVLSHSLDKMRKQETEIAPNKEGFRGQPFSWE